MVVSATDKVEEWLFQNYVDLILVIGTSGVVYPAAGYAWSVKMRGGKVAVFNIESDSGGGEKLDDWMFEGIVPVSFLAYCRALRKFTSRGLGC
jgi:NAD-dependent SIR2 family protein deacetylase